MTDDERKERIERLRAYPTCAWAADEIERLSAALAKAHKMADRWSSVASDFGDRLAASEAKVAELQTALQRIIDEAESDDGLTAWDGSDIARAALVSIAPAKVKPGQVEDISDEPS